VTHQNDLSAALDAFDPNLPIEASLTPPAEWYTLPEFHQLEVRRIFEKCWIPVGRLDQLERPGAYFAGQVCGNPYVVVRGDDQRLYGHHNVCRHKGAIVAQQEDDSPHNCRFFQCPYHGWEYHHDGQLKRAPMMGKQERFRRDDYGLQPISVDTWGPFVFIDLDGPSGGVDNPRELHADLEPLKGPLEELGFEHLKFHRRYVYEMNCNWKVFADNSLDGGYHVKYAHEGLADGLEMQDFETHIFDRSSIQICRTTGEDRRLGENVMGTVSHLWER
jgi:choline monooxygenase